MRDIDKEHLQSHQITLLLSGEYRHAKEFYSLKALSVSALIRIVPMSPGASRHLGNIDQGDHAMEENILAKHLKTKIGTALADTTAEEAIQTTDEALEVFGGVGAKLGGSDPKRSLAAAQQLKAIAVALDNSIDYSTGQAELNTNGGSTNNGAPAAVETSKPKEVGPTAPSIEEELGAELLKQAGDPLRARQWLTNLVGIFSTDPNLPDYVDQVVASLKRDNYPDKVVNHGGNFELRSTVALRKRATALETGFDDLVEKICGNLIHGEPVEDATQRALRELAKKSAAGTIDATPFFKSIEAATGVKHTDSTETFDKYVERVVVEVNKEAAKAAADKYSKLLDEVGDVLGYTRDTAKKETDADYRNRLLTAVLPYFQKTTDWAEKDLAKMRALADHNGVEYDTKETPYAIVRKMIDEKGGFRHTLKNV